MAGQLSKSTHRLVFLHVPRTGGTTLHHHFSAHFAPDEICPERFSRLGRYTESELAQWRFFSGHFNLDEIKRIPPPIFLVTVLRDPIERLLSNYYFWKRHRPSYIAQLQLRGPEITRTGSLADFLLSKEPVILNTTNNIIARNLAGEIHPQPDGTWFVRMGNEGLRVTDMQIVHRALGNLFSFKVFGDTSQLREIYAIVARTFGMNALTDLAHLNTRHEVDHSREPLIEEPITPEIKALLDQHTRLDRIVYQLALDHWRSIGPRPVG